ncbi:hypothetical protein N3K66_003171 [Trichothecium roseum]|uniref:Uncharacterized protein n=1 Tax=Trichothecium roseum TaxID=47278 RepID=A0ACC0V6K5_9HYPO|nr:hypothetical protein N3K66_003171 [Trichothecium roseum]
MSRPRMRVYAAGRNEFGQLSFGLDEHGGPEDFPQDIHSFTPILEGDTIDQVVASSSYTVNGTLVSAGSALQLRRYPDPRREQDDSVIWVEDGTGQVLATKTSPRDSHSTPRHELVQYLSVEAWAAQEPSRSWPCENPVKQIASYETGWIILHEDGTVKTLGDRRYHDCLGRPAAPQSPAEDPCELPDLVDLDEPFKYVAAGGYTVAAVTQSGAL